MILGVKCAFNLKPKVTNREITSGNDHPEPPFRVISRRSALITEKPAACMTVIQSLTDHPWSDTGGNPTSSIPLRQILGMVACPFSTSLHSPHIGLPACG